MNRQELLEELTEDIFAYVMQGAVPEDRFVGKIRPTGLDERFEDFESLVRLHFVLRPDVVDFVEELPTRLRSVKTQTQNVTSTQRGEISGRINWSDTIRERHSRAPGDTSLFVCENRTEDYDIPENLVLKRLLSIIYRTLRDCQDYFHEEFQWVTQRWKANLELVDVLMDIFERNVHVRRIRAPTEYEPTERMMRSAEESRSQIYRTAAELLADYRETVSGDREALKELLEDTAITPDDDETLLELYVLFKYIRAVEELEDDSFTLKTIQSGKQEIARIGGEDREIVLYHDNSGDRNISFDTSPRVEAGAEISRHEKIEARSNEVAREYFTNQDLRSVSRRPDVIVLEVKTGDSREYLITEVKNSTNHQTIRGGIKETLEYLAFLMENQDYVFESDTGYFGSGWNGVLVIQDLESETQPLHEQNTIKILQASEVQAKLGDVLENALDP